MCDHHQLRTGVVGGQGEIEHVAQLSDDIGGLFMQSDYSDVTLVVDGIKYAAHKVILAARSEYFRALLFGGMKESKPEIHQIELKGAGSEAFHFLLEYIYKGKINLGKIKVDSILDVLGLAHQYNFVSLETAISEHLAAVLRIDNVCLIYDLASIYSLASLSTTCQHFIDSNADEVLTQESFFQLSSRALVELLQRDSFYVDEIVLFSAVKRWVDNNPNQSHDDVIRCVRLTLISLDGLLNTVRPSGLLSAEAILDAIKMKSECSDMQLDHRGLLAPEENLSTTNRGAQVIRGEMKSSLLNGENQNYDLDRGFTRHPIDDINGQGIVISLAIPSIINTVKLLLWDKDMRSYSYRVEVSMDDKDWICVVDHSKYLCRSWQYLRFPERVVRFIRVIGTHNTVNRVFHLVAFECFFSRKPCSLSGGIIVPTHNVATMEASACVIEGVSRSRNTLINGETKKYDWDSGYTCHQLGSGAIIIQLAQPYIIDSMSLLLWDCDSRNYSFVIEVSTDNQNWKKVVDRSQEQCRSWQRAKFNGVVVIFIKIVGTHNSANEVFHCVHFECPSASIASGSDPETSVTAATTSQNFTPQIDGKPTNQSFPPSAHETRDVPLYDALSPRHQSAQQWVQQHNNTQQQHNSSHGGVGNVPQGQYARGLFHTSAHSSESTTSADSAEEGAVGGAPPNARS